MDYSDALARNHVEEVVLRRIRGMNSSSVACRSVRRFRSTLVTSVDADARGVCLSRAPFDALLYW
jgi:hypothetical protein